jgi:hypothetical protein
MMDGLSLVVFLPIHFISEIAVFWAAAQRIEGE